MMVGSINLATAGLDTPLSLALNGPPKPDPDLIALLLSYGASMNSILSSGRTLFDDIFSQTDLSIQHIDAASAMLRNLNAGTLKTFGSKNLCSLTRNGQFEIARCFLTAAEALGVDLEIDSSVHDAAGWGLSHYSARGDHCLSQYFPVLLRMASNALSTTEDGDSELYVAASHGNESGLRLALECSNSCQFIDTEASSGLTPLQTALRNRHFSVVSLLLNSGASLEVQDNLGLTPLCIAVDIDSPEAVGMILSHLNLRSRLTLDNPCMNVLSALHLAVKRGNLTIIRIFVGSWAEFNIPVDEGDALLQSAYKSGNSSIVKLLTESGMVRIPDVSVSSKPNIASMDNHAEQALPPLLDAVGLSQSFRFSGIDSDNIAFNIERQRSLGRSHPRSRIGRFLALPQRHNGYKPKPQSQAQTVLEILDPSLQGPSGSIWSQNGLFGASSRADARDTFSLEASIDATEHSSYINEKIGLTPLHIAAITNSAHSLGKMIDKDSGQLHVQTKDGRNALHLSLAARSANASKLLIERGVNGWVKSLLHGRPLHVASAVGDGESVRMLLSNGLTTDTAIDITSLINEPSDFFGTPLYAAAYGGHLGIVAQLLSSEANVDGAGQGNILGTPLLAACSQGHIDVVELLLARGANKNAFNRKFKSAMDLARAFQQPEVVRILE
jgi:ankyrin repeat protein